MRTLFFAALLVVVSSVPSDQSAHFERSIGADRVSGLESANYLININSPWRRVPAFKFDHQMISGFEIVQTEYSYFAQPWLHISPRPWLTLPFLDARFLLSHVPVEPAT
jgi:hypothetical protein